MSMELDHYFGGSHTFGTGQSRRHRSRTVPSARRQNDGWPPGYRRRGARRSTGPTPCQGIMNDEDLLAATKKAVGAMAKVNINNSVEFADRECGICLEEFEVGAEATKMPCDCKRSYFHSLCLQNWLSTSASCPFCRFPVKLVIPDDSDEED